MADAERGKGLDLLGPEIVARHRIDDLAATKRAAAEQPGDRFARGARLAKPRVLWAAVLGTQAVATLIAVYGLFMTPLVWGWALFVWGYALVWFVVNDRVKLLAYWVLDRVKAETPPAPTPKVAE